MPLDKLQCKTFFTGIKPPEYQLYISGIRSIWWFYDWMDTDSMKMSEKRQRERESGKRKKRLQPVNDNQ